MAHIKYVSPAGWNWDRPVAIPIKYSHRGLVGQDRRDFIKAAGCLFLPQLDQIKIAEDEVPVHLIALGSREAYGPNRNGDGFSAATCRSCHPTFVKFASYFNNHKNKPAQGDPRYGLVKASAYNEEMQRIELIIALNGTKTAAERNRGLVDETGLEKLARGEDLPVSMACRIPYDECSFCKNRARTRDEYCTSVKCAAGGCQDNLAKLVKVAGDVHHLHVDNPNPVWFDISRVFRPADRIAYGSKADWLTKAAGDQGVLAIADAVKMASDDWAPAEVVLYQDGRLGGWDLHRDNQLKLAFVWPSLERQEKAASPVQLAFLPEIQGEIPPAELGEIGSEKLAENLTALAEAKIVLPLRDFARVTNQTAAIKQATACLPGAIERMQQQGVLEQYLRSNPYRCDAKIASLRAPQLAKKYYASHSLSPDAVEHRVQRASLRGYVPSTFQEKQAADSLDAEQLARRYSAYRLSALERIAARDDVFPLTVRFSVRQNQV